jgi:hypothetical protein
LVRALVMIGMARQTAASAVPVQMWQGGHCPANGGSGVPGPGADVAEVSSVPVQMWAGVSPHLCHQLLHKPVGREQDGFLRRVHRQASLLVERTSNSAAFFVSFSV